MRDSYCAVCLMCVSVWMELHLCICLRQPDLGETLLVDMVHHDDFIVIAGWRAPRAEERQTQTTGEWYTVLTEKISQTDGEEAVNRIKTTNQFSCLFFSFLERFHCFPQPKSVNCVIREGSDTVMFQMQITIHLPLLNLGLSSHCLLWTGSQKTVARIAQQNCDTTPPPKARCCEQKCQKMTEVSSFDQSMSDRLYLNLNQLFFLSYNKKNLVCYED